MKVTVDRGICMGAANCVRLAKGAFVLDEQQISTVVDPSAVTEEQLLAAERSCPSGAIVVVKEESGP